MKPVIDAKEARDSIRSGMSHSHLMAKFNLSPKGLQSLLNKLVEVGAVTKGELFQLMPEFMKSAVISADATNQAPGRLTGKEVDAYEAARDIRSGVSNSDLMKKFGISPNGLEDLFEQLVGEALILPSELQFRLSSLAGTANANPSGHKRGKETELSSEHKGVWKCPACGRTRDREYEECPMCGVIVAKFKQRHSR
jgi:rubrerythrin